LYLCIIDGQRLDDVERVNNDLPNLNQIEPSSLENNEIEIEEINENGNYKLVQTFVFVKF